MNLSVSGIIDCRNRDGKAAEDRPDYVTDALEADREVGWRNGKPIVPHPDGVDEELGLDDDPTEAYSHYVRNGDLLRPDAGQFCIKLCDSVDNLSEATDELQTDASLVRKACDLHGIDVPDASTDESAESEDNLQLPSGETIPTTLLSDPSRPWRDSRVLTQLLATDGLSVDESALYLSDQLDTGVTASEVREAGQKANLLEGGSTDDPDALDVVPPEARTSKADDGNRVTPW